MDFQVYVVLLLIPISLLHYHVHAEAVESRCDSPTTYMRDAGSVKCHFSADLKQSRKCFHPYRYSMDPTNICTQDERSDEDSSKTVGIAVGVVVAILLAAAAIVLVVFRKRFRDRLSFFCRRTQNCKIPVEETHNQTGTHLLLSHRREQAIAEGLLEGHSTVTGEPEDEREDRENITEKDTDDTVSGVIRCREHIEPAAEPENERREGERSEAPRRQIQSAGGYRMLLVGKTGSGKSATGNTILGEEKFRVLSISLSVTETCQLERGQCLGRTVEITDTPGLCNTDLSEEAVVQEIAGGVSGLGMSPGFHVVLYVSMFCLSDLMVADVYKLLKTLLGEDVTKHMVVLFTFANELDDATKFEDLFKTVPQNVQEVVRECGNRCIPFNNYAEEAEKGDQLENLFSVIDKLLVENGYKIYNPTWNVEEALSQLRHYKQEKR